MKTKVDTSQFLQVGKTFVTTVNCALIQGVGNNGASLGPKTKVKVVSITPAHPDYPTRGYGQGVMVSVTNQKHKSYGLKFYISDIELAKGTLKAT